MDVVLPKPIKESKDTITLNRSDWDALIDSLEDAEDLAAVHARRAHEAAVGKDAARRSYVTGDEMRRLLAWESPVKIWQEKQGLSQRALASQAGISPSYLAEIETGRKPGSAAALRDLAGILQVPMENLVSSNRLQIAFSQLKEFVETGRSEAAAVTEGHRVVTALKERSIGDLDLAELKDRLRQLATDYGNANLPVEEGVMTAVIWGCLGSPSETMP
jgi:transcriptional regulator with XRE-family HTH domain